METLTAAVVLAWIVLIVLAFAMAGLVHQLRDVQAALIRQRRSTGSATRLVSDLPLSVRPQPGKTHSAVLLVDDRCSICTEIAPIFAGVAQVANADIDFIVLSYSASEKWEALSEVRFLSDADAYHLLDPGWQPAIGIVGTDGQVHAVEPADSEDAIRSVIGRIAVTEVNSR